MQPLAYKSNDNDYSETDMEVDSDYEMGLELEKTQRWKRRYIILGIIALCVVGGAVGGGIAASSSKTDQANPNSEAEPVAAPGGSGSRDPNNPNASPFAVYGSPNASPAAAPAAPSTPFPTVQNADELKDAILAVAREGGAEFENPNSYQSKALAYVLGQSLPAPKIPLGMEQQAIQLYALACIYYNTFSVHSDWTIAAYGKEISVPGWYTAQGWLRDGNEVCNDWWGITCNSNGQVEKLELNENGLTGYLPPETALLHDSLKYVDLFDNMIHNKGEVGNSFLGELTNLEFLFYGRTNFEYEGIPSVIAKLTKLQQYDCSYTIYVGPLQGSTFAPLTSLNYLAMDGNSYNSALPEELITLPSLEFLFVGFSNLEGDFEFVHRMPKIVELWMDDNPAMKGTIPTTIGLAPKLASFAATNCELFGSLPTELGLMLEMEQLWFYDNHLTGDIPTQLNNLYNLKLLGLQKNDLLGQVPEGVCKRFTPFGKLEKIEADCDDSDGTPEVACTCCTCCGEGCINDQARTRRSL
jgi:hypothetical protein